MTLSVAVVGPGNVGKALISQIAEANWKLSYTMSRQGIHDHDGTLLTTTHDMDHPKVPKVDLAFITTPSTEVEHNYVNYYTNVNIPVVSSAKWVLSCRFGSMRRKLHLIGPYAMAGGGTTTLPWVVDRMRGRKNVTMHGVLNGTMCFIFDQMDREKRTLDQAVERARKLGYAEPGASSPLGIIQGEIKDTGYKAGVISNLCLDLPVYMCAEEIDTFRPFGEEELARVVAEAHERRYIVSFLPEGARDEPDIIGGFEHRLSNGLRISAGFKNVRRNPVYSNLILTDANNAVLTHEGRNGIYLGPSGPGAGLHETAGAMMINARRMIKDLYNRHC